MTTRLFGDDTFGSGTFGGLASTTTAAGLTYHIDIGFTDGPFAVSPAWTEVTDYVRSISTRRGRNHELGRTQAGTAAIILDNRDRRFDPLYTSSPYYPNVLPMRHVRIRVDAPSLVTYDVFRGFVENWGQTWPAPAANAQGDAFIELQAVDAFKVFQLAQLLAYPAAVIADNPVAYYRLAETTFETAASEVGEGLDGAYVAGAVLESPGPLVGSATAPDLTNGYVILPDVSTFDDLADKSMTVECWVRPEDISAATRIVYGDDVWFLITGSSGSLTWGYDSADITDTPTVTAAGALAVNTWAHIAAVRDWAAGTQTIYVNGAQVATGHFGRKETGPSRTSYTISALSTPFRGRVSHVAIYDQALPLNRIQAHLAATMDRLEGVGAGTAIGYVLDALGWPAGLRQIGTGLSTVTLVPDGSALDVLQLIAEDTEHGLFAMSGAGVATFIGREVLEGTGAPVSTFGDSGAEKRYRDLKLAYDDQDLWTQVEVAGASSTYVASDATAQATYGRRTLQVQGAAATANEVQAQADGLLARYKGPHTRPTTLTTNKEPTEQLGRALADRVTVKRRPPGGGTISVDALIEGVNHDATANQVLQTTFQLAPADQVAWILSDTTYSVLGTTTDLGW